MERQILSEDVKKSFYEFPDKFKDLDTNEVSSIQRKILEGSFVFSSLRLVSFERDDPIGDRFSPVVTFTEHPSHSFVLFVEPQDELVLTALSSFLSNRISDSALVGRSFACRSDTNMHDFVMTVLDWGQVEQLLLCINWHYLKCAL